MCTQLPPSVIFDRVTPDGLLITVIWLVGLWLISKAKTDLPWQEQPKALDPEITDNQIKFKAETQTNDKEVSTTRTIVVFVIASIVTLAAGVVLEQNGGAIASNVGVSGVIFGATILAAATSLPEVSTGLEAIKLQDYELAVSDVFGGNAFLPVLFLLATLLSGQAVLPQATKVDIYISGLGILLTTVYIYGLIFRSTRRVFHMGIDSLVVLVLYTVGILGLVAVARG